MGVILREDQLSFAGKQLSDIVSLVEYLASYLPFNLILANIGKIFAMKSPPALAQVLH